MSQTPTFDATPNAERAEVLLATRPPTVAEVLAEHPAGGEGT